MLTTTRRRPDNKNNLLARGVTLWRCIADDFEQAILIGKYANGARLPAETDVAARYGVNRHTVRRALAELVTRGLVYTERGSGSFVRTDKLAYPIARRTRFSEIIAASGHEAEGRLHGAWIEPASAEIAARLKLKVGERVVRMEIVRAADRVPISVATTWFAAETFHDAPKIFRRLHSITRTLELYGIKDYRRQWTKITAAFADAVDAGRLRLSVQRPILVVESLDVTSNGEPILTTRGRFAADRVALIVESDGAL
jgi:GntR family transcriptional regulator, phosphonate transport system regulatory protein